MRNRLIRMPVLLIVAGSLWVGAVEAIAASDPNFRGQSATVNLQDLILPDDGTEAFTRLVDLQAEMQTSAAEDRSRLQQVRRAWESNPTAENEAAMADASAGVIARQHRQFGALQEATGEAEKVIQGFLQQLSSAHQAVEEQRSQSRTALRGQEEQREHIGAELRLLAQRLPELTGEDGEIQDLDLETAVYDAKAAFDYYTLLVKLSDSEGQSTTADLEDLQRAEQQLRRLHGHLKRLHSHAGRQRILLVHVAESQIRRTWRRQLLHGLASILRRGNTLDADLFSVRDIELIPPAGTPLFSDERRDGVSGSAADILREFANAAGTQQVNPTHNRGD